MNTIIISQRAELTETLTCVIYTLRLNFIRRKINFQQTQETLLACISLTMCIQLRQTFLQIHLEKCAGGGGGGGRKVLKRYFCFNYSVNAFILSENMKF
jgi:hypothetical protein